MFRRTASGSRRSSRSSTRRSPARSTSRSASWPTARARPHAGRLRARPAIFFALACTTYVEGASLHQDRGGRDRLRALRLQRARELRGRLGDPARLHHPASRSRRSRRRTTWPRSTRRSGQARDELLLCFAIIGLRRDPQHPRLLQDAREPDRGAGRRRPRAPGARDRPRADSSSSTSTRSPTRSTSATRRRGATRCSRSGWRP